jgi:hypothetical protein
LWQSKYENSKNQLKNKAFNHQQELSTLHAKLSKYTELEDALARAKKQELLLSLSQLKLS